MPLRKVAVPVVMPVVMAVVLVAVLAVAAFFVKRERDAKNAMERVALARGLARHAAEVRDTDLTLAMRLGGAAFLIHPEPQTRDGLVDTLVAYARTDFYRLDPSGVQAAALSDDGTFALTTDDDGISVWNLTTWLDPDVDLTDKDDRLSVLKGHKELVFALALSADGRTALTGDDGGTTLVWDLSDPAKPVRRATLATKEPFEAIRLTRDARTAVTAGSDGVLTVWDLADPAHPVRRSATDTHHRRIVTLGLTADGRTAVSGGTDKNVVIWDLSNPAEPAKVTALDLPYPFVEELAVSADGGTLVVGNPGRADVWDLTDRARPKHTATLPVDSTDVYDVALTPDGRTALIGGDGGTAVLWDLTDRAEPVREAGLRSYAQEISATTLSADGRMALTASVDRGPALWDLRELDTMRADPADHVCGSSSWLTLTRAEWARFAGSAPYESDLCLLR
ncbi:hypothetical protein OIE66_28600 [Nonomuraea sp. NBC_01738]|uniref:WD40 repeat domain-containing protein n=1 Tax=Nonomuraea sp. NBC_01738 TaxID=2976003 RepID=UPI002E0DB793|nr:hypothetical protein OIE66_28600 [Nonomuraea sp. NBC_01738]